jgi:hypothetical protein
MRENDKAHEVTRDVTAWAFSRIEPKLCSNLTSSLGDASVLSAAGEALSSISRTDG